MDPCPSLPFRLKMAKVLKVLKVLNFSGTGIINTFRCPFTGGAVNPHTLAPNDPHPNATQGVPGPLRRARGTASSGRSNQRVGRPFIA